MKLSPLQIARYQYTPKLPGMLRNGIAEICVKNGEATQSVADQEKIAALFPNTYGKNEITFQKGQNTSETKKQVVGVILSGGQAPGGHNVVCGLYDALKATNPENVLIGFKGGPSGLLDNDFIVFEDDYINQYRNTGGFDIIGSGRTKLPIYCILYCTTIFRFRKESFFQLPCFSGFSAIFTKHFYLGNKALLTVNYDPLYNLIRKECFT